MTEMEKTVLHWLEDLGIDPSMTDWDIQNRMREIKLGSEAAMNLTLATKIIGQSSQILAVLIDKRLDKNQTVWYNTSTIKERK